MLNSPLSLLNSLKKNELNALILDGSRRLYKKNEIIINEGESSDSAYLIHSGKVKIFLSDEQGREIVLREMSAGEYFGEMSLLDKRERSATVMATEPADLTTITQDNFRKCMRSNPEILERIILGLVTNLREANKKISSLVFTGASARVLNMLLALAKQQDGSLVVDKKPTQQHIANVVGVSREMVSRILKVLVDEKQISLSGKQIVICRKAVNEYAGGRQAR
jgi:CRP/FNR family cyclic AMP-dependent transcriptional regulator